MRRLVLAAVAVTCANCAFFEAYPLFGQTLGVTAALPETPVGRAFPDPLPLYVELLGVDGERVWKRIHEVLADHQIGILREGVRGLDGYVECRRFSVTLPGLVNTTDYRPGEVVLGYPSRTVRLDHRLIVHESAHHSGLVRVWVDATIRVNDHEPDEIRGPAIAANRLLRRIVEPFKVVKEWRLEPERGGVPSRRGTTAFTR